MFKPSVSASLVDFVLIPGAISSGSSTSRSTSPSADAAVSGAATGVSNFAFLILVGEVTTTGSTALRAASVSRAFQLFSRSLRAVCSNRVQSTGHHETQILRPFQECRLCLPWFFNIAPRRTKATCVGLQFDGIELWDEHYDGSTCSSFLHQFGSVEPNHWTAEIHVQNDDFWVFPYRHFYRSLRTVSQTREQDLVHYRKLGHDLVPHSICGCHQYRNACRFDGLRRCLSLHGCSWSSCSENHT